MVRSKGVQVFRVNTVIFFFVAIFTNFSGESKLSARL